PAGIARELVGLPAGSVIGSVPSVGADELVVPATGDWGTIFTLVRSLTGVDFSAYKHSTLHRRVSRRMMLKRISKFADYVKLLKSDPAEVDALFQDFLINVTSFFRDPHVFQALRRRVFPKLLRGKDSSTTVRIWVPGCSTGEEVYSLAITAIE